MMNFLYLSLLALLPSLGNMPEGHVPVHTFYVSITDIHYQPETAILKIKVKTFTNDLELALHEFGMAEEALLSDGINPEEKSFLYRYLSESLSIKINKEARNFELEKVSPELEATWTYLSIKNVPTVEELWVDNRLLLNVLEGQSNIVRLKANGKELNANLDRRVHTETFIF